MTTTASPEPIPAEHTRHLWNALRWAAAPTEWEPLTGRAIALRLGISETKASRHKTGRTPVTWDELVSYCTRLGLEPAEVINHNQ